MAIGAAGAIDGAASINVTVRVRPFTIREASQLVKTDDGPLFLGDGSLAAVPAPKLGGKGLRSVIKVVDEKCLIFDPPEDNPVQRFSRSVVPQGKRSKDQTFGFDRVFDENTTQGDVYEATTKNLLDSVLDGYNATVFAYGATGCGKTHTITGTAQQPGIIFMTMQELFEKVGEIQETKESEVTLSYLEIYNETIRDLLAPGVGGKQGLMLREDASQAVSVAGLSAHKPQNVAEVMDMVIRGNAARTQSPTEANATSSRSHAVLQVGIALKDRNADVHEPVTMATLSIIDLAGSERASATKNRGERLLEGANINKSLLALGSCINALCDPRKKNHVPYRNSKLTRLLKFSLGGNCRTVMIVCVSPSSQHFDETQNTLRYANRAKNIQTKSVRNVYNVDRHVKDYLKKIDEQMTRINELAAQNKHLEELAFAKFRKAEAKRIELAHDGIQRIRAAYDHSLDDRRDRISGMKKLRQIERRIAALSGWIGAFDSVCETREEEEAPPALATMRKTAQGILVELEGSRQHYHVRLGKNNWTRAVDTALQDGLRQLQSLDGAAPTSGPESAEETGLRREVEMLKARADVEFHLAVLEQERTASAEGGLAQLLLTSHFETVAILNQILQMSDSDALAAARKVLGKLLQACTETSGQVIKPDGGLQITHAVPPTRTGTPRKRKQVNLLGPSPLKAKLRASALPAHLAPELPGLGSSPRLSPNPTSRAPAAAGSPRRRVKLGGGARKVVLLSSGNGTGTPKRKSPKKRGVRWRDELAGDEGEVNQSLVEFAGTPKKLDLTPTGVQESESEDPWREGEGSGDGSSPLPGLPTGAEGRRAVNLTAPAAPVGSGRFATGFLTKRADGEGMSSPPSAMPPPRTITSLTAGAWHPTPTKVDDHQQVTGAGDDLTPLREMEANRAPHAHLHSNSAGRPSTHVHRRTSSVPATSLASTSSRAIPDPNNENSALWDGSSASNSDAEPSAALPAGMKVNAEDLRAAMRERRHARASSAGISAQTLAAAQGRRTDSRRRSPTASAANSPPGSLVNATGSEGSQQGIFSASHARRMVRSDRSEEGSASGSGRGVLSPRSRSIAKGAAPGAGTGRRSMFEASSGPAAGGGTPAGAGKAGRASCAGVVGGSGAGAGKKVWR